MSYAELMASSMDEPLGTQPYEEDLWEMRCRDRARPVDLDRARSVAEALADLHAEPCSPSSYRPGLTRALAAGDGIARIADRLAERQTVRHQDRLEAIEIATVCWRWKLAPKRHRARKVHGAVKPANVFFRGTACALVDTLPLRGEAAEDVARLTIHFVCQSVANRGRFRGALRECWYAFWDTYLGRTRDEEILDVIPPFYAREVLELVAQNAPFPRRSEAQDEMVRFAEALLGERRFPLESAERFFS